MPYTLITPWENETWVDNDFTPYARLAGRRFIGGTYTGTKPVSLTDVPRGVTLLVNGSTVTENRTPSQDDLADADYYFLGGHTYVVSNAQAAVLTAAGYGDYLTLVV